VRRVEDITEALRGGARVSPSTMSDLNRKIYGTIGARREQPRGGKHPHVYLDGIVLNRSWAGEVRNVSLLMAMAVNGKGYREILGICEGQGRQGGLERASPPPPPRRGPDPRPILSTQPPATNKSSAEPAHQLLLSTDFGVIFMTWMADLSCSIIPFLIVGTVRSITFGTVIGGLDSSALAKPAPTIARIVAIAYRPHMSSPFKRTPLTSYCALEMR
jgi:hypothetical protein